MSLIAHVGPRWNVLGQQFNSTKSYIILFLWIGLKSCKPFQSKYRSKILLYFFSFKFISLFHTTYARISNCVFFFALTHSNIFSFVHFCWIFLFQLTLSTFISFQIIYIHFIHFFQFIYSSLVFLLTFEVPLTLNHGRKKAKHPCAPFFHGYQTCDCKHFGITTTCHKWTKCCIDDDVFFHHGKRQSKK